MRRGWVWIGTNKWWPEMFGEPPKIPGATWKRIPDPADFRETAHETAHDTPETTA